MKINFSKNKLIKILKDRFGFIVYFIIFVIAAWLCYFSYQNIYLVVISPKDIKQNEIIAKKQKVNIELFNIINEKISDKKGVLNETSLEIKNPFK